MNRFALVTAIATLAFWPLGRATAQHMSASDTASDSGPVIHGRTFSTGTRTGWTFSTPHLDINGGLYYVHTAPANVSEGFFRLHLQTALGIHTVQLSSDLLWIPAFGATPVWSGALDLAPIPQESPLYVAAGVGLISGRDSSSDRLAGWVHATVAIRTPIHELTPFVEIGKALSAGNKAEFLFGVAHPLAPYKLHLP